MYTEKPSKRNRCDGLAVANVEKGRCVVVPGGPVGTCEVGPVDPVGPGDVVTPVDPVGTWVVGAGVPVAACVVRTGHHQKMNQMHSHFQFSKKDQNYVLDCIRSVT